MKTVAFNKRSIESLPVSKKTGYTYYSHPEIKDLKVAVTITGSKIFLIRKYINKKNIYIRLGEYNTAI